MSQFFFLYPGLEFAQEPKIYWYVTIGLNIQRNFLPKKKVNGNQLLIEPPGLRSGQKNEIVLVGQRYLF